MYAVSASSSRMLAGFTSRWKSPAACRASSPSATSVQILIATSRLEHAVALELVVERAARDQPLRQVREALVLTGVEHRDHVRVGQPLRNARLALEALPEDAVMRRGPA